MNVYITAHYVKIALGSFVFYEIIKTRCFLELCNEYGNGTSSKMQLPLDFNTLNLGWSKEKTERQRILRYEKAGFWFVGKLIW